MLPKSCANRTSDAACLPPVASNNTTIKTYGNCRRVVDVGLKRDYAWTFIVADVRQPIVGADFLIHYSLLVDLKSRCLRDMRTGLAIPATLSSIKPLSLKSRHYSERLHEIIRSVSGTDSSHNEGRTS